MASTCGRVARSSASDIVYGPSGSMHSNPAAVRISRNGPGWLLSGPDVINAVGMLGAVDALFKGRARVGNDIAGDDPATRTQPNRCEARSQWLPGRFPARSPDPPGPPTR